MIIRKSTTGTPGRHTAVCYSPPFSPKNEDIQQKWVPRIIFIEFLQAQRAVSHKRAILMAKMKEFG